MRKALLSLQALNLLFWILSILLLGVILVVPFLQIDRNFNIAASFSIAGILRTWDASLLSALWNSIVLSIIASLFAIFCGGLLADIIERRPRWIFLIMIAVYAVNPVARALSYFDLFQLYTPFYDWTIALFGRRFATTILVPALILGVHYFPIYLMRNLFVLKKSNTAHRLPALLESLFDDIPLWLRGFPISFALFFLLTFFDYWVIQVISGNTVLYWTPLFIQKGFQARAVSEAALMIVIGLLVTFLSYLAALAASSLLRLLWRQLRPVWFVRWRSSVRSRRSFKQWIAWLVLAFLSWPLIGSIIRLAQYLMENPSITLMEDTGRSIVVMIGLGIAMGALCATLGLILSAVFQQNIRRFRWWLPALYLLALVPEAAYVLFSLFVTGIGALKGNLLWLAFLMASFSIPISFFLWESLWGESEKQKLWMAGFALEHRPVETVTTILREWMRPWAIVFVVVFWLTIDNVFITDFAAGPKWKPLSAVVFNATKRGFSEEEFFSSVIGTLCVLGVIIVTLLLSKDRRSRLADPVTH